MNRLGLAALIGITLTSPANAAWFCKPWLAKSLNPEAGVTILDAGLSRDLQDYLMRGEPVPFVITGSFSRFQSGWTVIAWLTPGQVCTNRIGYPAEAYWAWHDELFGLEA